MDQHESASTGHQPATEPTSDTTTATTSESNTELSTSLLARCGVGGVLMGLANLVPGISGGTMLVAAGVYTPFINAISDLSRLKFRRSSIVILGAVVLAAIIAIGGGAGLISKGLESFRWGMYSLFIGLTLGGAPIMLKLVKGQDGKLGPGVGGAITGVIAMLGLVFLQMQGATGGSGASGGAAMFLLFLGGVAGASAMILPGVSGAYLLLLLGQYETIIDAIKTFVKAAAKADVATAMSTLSVVIPVGIGVVAGIVSVGNLLKWLLNHQEKATLGFLLGLLIAAPAGLYPFKEGTPPALGDTFEGEIVTEESLPDILESPKDWPESYFTPGPTHLGGAAGLIALGFIATAGLAKLGSAKED